MRAFGLLLVGVAAAASLPAEQADTIQQLIARLPEPAAHAARLHAASDHRRTLLEEYGRHHDALLWSSGGAATAPAHALLELLQAAPAYGLIASDYDAERLAAQRRTLDAERNATPGQWAAFDVALSNAAVTLLHDLHFGRIDPHAVGFDLPRRQDRFDAAAYLEELTLRTDAAAVVAEVEPDFLHYRLLRQSLARYRQLAATPDLTAQRVRQIELTLERWRWVPPLEAPTLIVNIPQFRLLLFRSAVDSEADMLRMDVIVGQTYPRLHMPLFTADMSAIVFRPYWDVPPHILRAEILPLLARRPHYLESQNMELVGNGADAAPLPATAENLSALAAGRLRLRQRPGPDNALGLIKFVLPNSFDVYLHSTPAPRLFAEPRRAFSHGCIRVSDAVALAVDVLRGTPGDWTAARVRAAMNGAATVRVRLAQPVHVLILYGTAIASEDGALHFFDDIYGYDRRLEGLLGLNPVTTRR